MFVVVVLCHLLWEPNISSTEGEATLPQTTLTEVVTIERVIPAAPHYDDIANTITDDAIDLLAAITYLEAGNQSLLGQRAVVEVIFNRVDSPLFPDNIHDVIFQAEPVQFTTSLIIDRAAPTDEQYEAIQLTLEESVPLLPPDVLYFSTSNGRKAYEKIGAHYFCY